MKYDVIFLSRFKKSLRKLDKQTQDRIKEWIDEHLIDCVNPRLNGKALTGEFKGFCKILQACRKTTTKEQVYK